MANESNSLEKIVNLAQRRGFVFQSSEIYGGLAGAWDYGPLGVQLKRKLENYWWKSMVQFRDDIVGLDSSILMHPKTWEASGHVENFSDPLIDCKKCKLRFRADQISKEDIDKKSCPSCKGELTDVRKFNLMFKTHIGAIDDGSGLLYLRPETAQGIYLDYKSISKTNRMKVPFGIAQVGKAFRNEITTKHFIFRSCEFEQMEMQYFVQPTKDEYYFNYWKDERFSYYKKIGINPQKLRLRQHAADELAHYAKTAVDVEYEFPMGWNEVEGIHNRTDFDLKRHQAFSNKDLQFNDQENNTQFTPYIIEASSGLTRQVLMVLCDGYEEQKIADKGNEDDYRIVLHLDEKIAPITAAIMPLVKKDGLAEMAVQLRQKLCRYFTTDYDQSGAIGRRYRRQDEIGTPFCLTVDYQTKDDKTITLRYRDTMTQIRLHTEEVADFINSKINH